MNTTTKSPRRVLTYILKEVDEAKKEKLAGYKPIDGYLEIIDNCEEVDLDEINPEFHSELLIRMMKNFSFYAAYISRWIEQSAPTNLSEELAIEMIRAGQSSFLCDNLVCFSTLPASIAIALIRTRDRRICYLVARFVRKFYRFSHKEIALCLIEEGFEDILRQEIDSFYRESLES